MIEWHISKYGACRSYAEVPEGAEIQTVNGRHVAGECEACGRVVLSGQEHYRWIDGLTCKRCGGPDVALIHGWFKHG